MQKALLVLTFLSKALGLLTAFDTIPGIDPKIGLLIFAVASLAKDFIRGLGDILDDGKRNGSFQPNLPGIGALLLGACLLSGCSSFKTVQYDHTFFGADGKTPLRSETETRVSARTFWDAKSQLANFAASQSAKTQSTKVGALSGESTGTNALAVLRELKGIVEALPK